MTPTSTSSNQVNQVSAKLWWHDHGTEVNKIQVSAGASIR